MHSSTSSSDETPRADADGAAELPTAESVVRVVPQLPRGFWLAVLALTLAGVLSWEWKMRSIGLTTADLGDTPGHWAVERRKLDRDEADIAIVGDSRILFDTDLSLLESMTGKRVVQLSVVGTNALFLLEHVAQKTGFDGVVLVGLAEASFFRPLAGGAGYAARQMAYFETESPSQRIGHRLQLVLSRVFAFIDEGHRLSTLLTMFDVPRRFVRSPYDSPWKVMETRERRQTWMWREIWENPWRLTQTRRAWNDFKGEPANDELVGATIARAKTAIDAIRARGGDVVFLRPPSAGPLLANEVARFPRARVWDRLVRETGTVGLHFADEPSLAAMDLPEYSHLSPPCARHYTFAYATRLRERIPRLAAQPIALEPLRPTEACVRREYAAVPRTPFPEMPPPKQPPPKR